MKYKHFSPAAEQKCCKLLRFCTDSWYVNNVHVTVAGGGWKSAAMDELFNGTSPSLACLKTL